LTCSKWDKICWKELWPSELSDGWFPNLESTKVGFQFHVSLVEVYATSKTIDWHPKAAKLSKNYLF
jgi:hypothetical protein